MPLTKTQKRTLAVVVVVGGASGLHALREMLRQAVREQQLICISSLPDERSKRSRAPKVAVDGVFARRLAKILKICVPSPFSYEAGLIYTQTALLVARTFLTDFSSQIEGGVGRCVSCRCLLINIHRNCTCCRSHALPPRPSSSHKKYSAPPRFFYLHLLFFADTSSLAMQLDCASCLRCSVVLLSQPQLSTARSSTCRRE